jgi:hypothetical protein
LNSDAYRSLGQTRRALGLRPKAETLSGVEGPAGLRIASPLPETKRTPGEAPGVEVVWFPVEERPFRAAKRSNRKIAL